MNDSWKETVRASAASIVDNMKIARELAEMGVPRSTIESTLEVLRAQHALFEASVKAYLEEIGRG